MSKIECLTFENISKYYQHHAIFKDISFQCYAGEFVALVGVNGAGKTTLIKTLLDFIPLDNGEIYISGIPHIKPDARTHLAYLPERFKAPDYLTGQLFLQAMRHLHGTGYEQKKLHQLCNILDFPQAALTRTIRHYSKGMAQKIGLMSCLLSDKPLLVLDEPMSGLDPKARAQLKQYLLGLKAAGTSVFFTTHLLNDVEELCDRMAVLHNSKLCFIGSPTACCQKFNTNSLETAYLRCIADSEHTVSDTA